MNTATNSMLATKHMTSLKFKKAQIVKRHLCLLVDNLPAAAQFVDSMKDGAEYTVTIKRQKRSLTANAYAWQLMGQLAKAFGIPTNEVYRNLILEIGDNFEIIILREDAVQSFTDHWQEKGLGWIVRPVGEHVLRGYVEVAVYYGSSTYDSKQMSELIDLIVLECKEQGIETLPPDRLEAMKDEWSGIREQTDKSAANQP